MNCIEDFKSTTIDWRASIKRNQQKTLLVIFTFVLIYLLVGLLIDLYIYANHFPIATVWQLFVALISLKIFPIATFVTGLFALFSLFITFTFNHKLALLGTHYREITSETAITFREKMLYNIVEELKVAAVLQFRPRIYIIDARYMNAFASGFDEKSSMIAITSGLLIKLDRSELEAVIAHEVSHIRHADIRLTLIASVLVNSLLMLVDILFFSTLFRERSRDNETRNQLFFFILVLRYCLPLITILLMLYLSRTREYMADAGSVRLIRDNEPLARALLKIQDDHMQNKEEYSFTYKHTPHESVRQAAYIYDPIKAGIEIRSSLNELFSTHPSLTKRLSAIGWNRKPPERKM
ncbi:zinc metalloprotease HtpX [Coxiella endosymbiont of Amblyomma americanum]|uniref:zinc metalloprotease HtpX n=1 Tax=Coxiella endosymbiont of Amblyomma americanum TaxID=325775 RepID=UPI00057E0BDE|nr:zinc metalloprotease HtpX [Coxiella endosymbiont of Amblyomma americanum]AJC50643.1 heat shock protein HtpX [Coxiella endosymbiont of Amblyomma americanum]AUJ58972.1 zinc metalloprotease HtpX [Coxiella-like endosymbiont of Amblyomma americanum]